MTSGNDSLQMRGPTEANKKRQPCCDHCQTGLGLFTFSLSPSTKNMHRQEQPVFHGVTPQHQFLSLKANCSQQISPQIPKVWGGANVRAKCHRPPDTGPAFSLFVLQITQPFPIHYCTLSLSWPGFTRKETEAFRTSACPKLKTIFQQCSMQTTPRRIRPARRTEPQLDPR